MHYQEKIAPKPDNICAIIVTYHPDEDLFDRIQRIYKQVKKVIIVDNSSTEASLQIIKGVTSRLIGVHVILNDSNLGIATALNYGVQYATDSDDGYEWFLTLDQDTIPSPLMVENLIEAYTDCPFKEAVGIVGSNYKEKTTGEMLFVSDSEKVGTWAEVKNLPTSGSLTSIKIFSNVGVFRDELFIDYVDTDYCMRLRDIGYKIIISTKLSMQHPLGYYKSSNLYKFLYGRIMVSNYPSLRHYYWTRNGVILIRERFWKDLKWSFHEIYYLLIRRPLAVILFEDNKIAKIRNICLGVWHAFFLKKLRRI